MIVEAPGTCRNGREDCDETKIITDFVCWSVRRCDRVKVKVRHSLNLAHPMERVVVLAPDPPLKPISLARTSPMSPLTASPKRPSLGTLVADSVVDVVADAQDVVGEDVGSGDVESGCRRWC